MANHPLTKVLSRERMAMCDAYTIETLGIPSRTLMERAAQGVVSYMVAHNDIYPLANSHIVVLCGSGNNGGDGFAVARFLSQRPHGRISVCYVGKRLSNGSPDTGCMSTECQRQYELMLDTLIPIYAPSHMTEIIKGADIVVDAMLGIGLDRDIHGEIADLIHLINESHLPTLAVDIPTGVCANTGRILGYAINATATVTMQNIKKGMLLYPGADHCGDIFVCDIGVDISPAAEEQTFLADKALLFHAMPPRSRRTHKGTYGQVALVCGSEEMCGAAVLAAKGAIRAGVGLVRVVTPSINRATVNMTLPEALVSCYESHQPIPQDLLTQINACQGVVMGCGWSTSQASLDWLSVLLENLPIDPQFPVVLDADALNLLSKHPYLWDARLLRCGNEQVIITPHPMEFARLSGVSVKDILADPLTHASTFAHEKGVVVVLKDAHTVIASPNGDIFICPYGNAGMAKGGSGDVLAGILGSILVQNHHRIGEDISLCQLASAAVALHALSGDVAAEIYGEYAMTPSDMAEAVGAVTWKFSHTATKIETNL